ncbi:calmodulin-binding transcription activator 1 isoform X1 [Lates japonicus]|uniref:Calmodulin-binding transcription activator 1 isoform X1 n=1 Tax=Lates japonicus TaxID=270547 RepID=A0AAD3NI93_LATJO|nr:calmodulin-binding transcription activator 1 isoform X1 [Lates japonicus]
MEALTEVLARLAPSSCSSTRDLYRAAHRHEEVVGPKPQPGSVRVQLRLGPQKWCTESASRRHIQTCGAGNGEGGRRHYLQQASDGGGGGTGEQEEWQFIMETNNSDGNRSQQQLQPLLKGTSMVQGLWLSASHQGLGGGASNGGQGRAWRSAWITLTSLLETSSPDLIKLHLQWMAVEPPYQPGAYMLTS